MKTENISKSADGSKIKRIYLKKINIIITITANMISFFYN